MAREKAKKEMIEKLKMKRNQDGIQMNAKLSLRNDLVFSALFGSKSQILSLYTHDSKHYSHLKMFSAS